jgi:prepilin-type N-terminal cleavage/methylation domain-containing protein
MRHGEAGFTLAELLVSVVILTIIGGALTEATILGLRTTGRTADRIAESSDAQLVSTWFSTDVQSAQTVETQVQDPACDVSPLLRLTWTDQGVAHVVSYAYSSGAEKQLVRRHWVDPLPCPTPTAPANAQTLARSLGQAPTVTCSGPGGTCAVPVNVMLSLTEASGAGYQLRASTRTGS